MSIRRVLLYGFFGSGVATCFKAGQWQLRRKVWKEDLIDFRVDQLQQSPIEIEGSPFPWTANDAELKTWLYRPIIIRGRFDTSKEMPILRKFAGMNGYVIICPFVLDSGDVVLINRGWVPLDLKDSRTRPKDNEVVTVTGVLRETEERGKYVPENSPKMSEWYYINLEQMCQQWNIRRTEQTTKYFIQLIEPTRDRNFYEGEEIQLEDFPVKNSIHDFLNWTIMPSGHLGYAVFWFGSAGIFSVATILALLKKI